ncbi:hypothetical protein Q5427_10975 [Brochothrix thermosphacta]|uniref:hypothetical protein n=1 Tax=Brochothrix thermosphacta TaxID=2756 RepID=UPI002712A00B|nr:hypothetical protein [Brochothrix thermosphacta]MDO7864811.1 hypothetical protein [Brochothrix thermosphacta]
MKYIKRPIPVEAFRVHEKTTFDECPDWLQKAVEEEIVSYVSPSIMEGKIGSIETLEGRMYFSNGDYIIRGVRGELYAHDGDIFEEVYKPVELTEGSSHDYELVFVIGYYPEVGNINASPEYDWENAFHSLEKLNTYLNSKGYYSTSDSEDGLLYKNDDWEEAIVVTIEIRD